jgi:hypothetical protein
VDSRVPAGFVEDKSFEGWVPVLGSIEWIIGRAGERLRVLLAAVNIADGWVHPAEFRSSEGGRGM